MEAAQRRLGTVSGMTTSARSTGTLTAAQRQLLLGVCLVAGAVTVVPATYNYLLNPMLAGLHATSSQSSLVRQLPSIAALLVVFLSGVLGGRLGARRLISGAAVLFTAGTAVVACAPVFPVAAAGLVMESVGSSAMVVVALGLLASGIQDDEARGGAFSTYAMVSPVVYMAAPVLAGALVGATSWRVVPAMWAVSGVVMLFSARRLLPPPGAERGSGELWTPALAGVALALFVQGVSRVSSDGWTSTATLLCFGGVALVLVVLVVLFRRMDTPTLSLAALGQGGMLVLLVVVMLIPFAATLWFYATVGYQYVYGLSLLQTALVMVPAQAAGLLGTVVARRLIARRGITVTGVAGICAMAGSLLLCQFVVVGTPIWVPMVVMGVFAVTSTWTSIPVTNAIMNTAPAGEEGSASAFRSAAANIGGAVGVVIVSTVVFAVVQGSLSQQLASQGLSSEQSAAIAQQMRDGASSESVASDYAVPVEQVDQISADQQAAMVDGLHAQSSLGTGVALLAALVFLTGRRRQERLSRQARSPSPAK